MAARRQTTGEGPTCPIVPHHGRMLVHQDWGQRYWCPAASHGGNGRFFDQDEVDGYQLNEGDEMQLYESTAQKIIGHELTIDEGVTLIAKQTKAGSGKVREKLTTMVDALKTDSEEKETARKEAKATNAKKRKAAATKERKPRARKEWIAPDQFARVRDEAGLSNTAIAKAWGKSPSRMTELTKGTKATQGGSIDIFNEFCEIVGRLKDEAAGTEEDA